MSSLRVLRRLLPAAIRSTSFLVSVEHKARCQIHPFPGGVDYTHTYTISLALSLSKQTHTHSHARTHGAKQQFTFLMGPNAAPNNYNEIRDREAKGLKLSFSSG